MTDCHLDSLMNFPQPPLLLPKHALFICFFFILLSDFDPSSISLPRSLLALTLDILAKRSRLVSMRVPVCFMILLHRLTNFLRSNDCLVGHVLVSAMEMCHEYSIIVFVLHGLVQKHDANVSMLIFRATTRTPCPS